MNRIYCPSTNCGEWIPPKYIRDDVGHCQKCGFMVCVTCSGRAHGGEDCPQDPEMLKFFETAEKHKFQKCYSCKAMVELERGCNHMYVDHFYPWFGDERGLMPAQDLPLYSTILLRVWIKMEVV